MAALPGLKKSQHPALNGALGKKAARFLRFAPMSVENDDGDGDLGQAGGSVPWSGSRSANALSTYGRTGSDAEREINKPACRSLSALGPA
jgi:hypothetical protein